MNYYILISFIIIIISICVYNYFNVLQEGLDSKKTNNISGQHYGELLKEIKRDKINITQLEKNNIKYNKILDCLTYRQEGYDAKKKHAKSGKTKQVANHKQKIKDSYAKLRKLNI